MAAFEVTTEDKEFCFLRNRVNSKLRRRRACSSRGNAFSKRFSTGIEDSLDENTMCVVHPRRGELLNHRV
jgi:hypothetical protein